MSRAKCAFRAYVNREHRESGNKVLEARNDDWFIYTRLGLRRTEFSSGILTPFSAPRGLDLFREKSQLFTYALLSRRCVQNSGGFLRFVGMVLALRKVQKAI